MGEIGISRREYLYECNHVDLILILRGYIKRQAHLWSTTRWETYHILMAQYGGDELAKKGIHAPIDLMRFPWEKKAISDDPQEDSDTPSAEDVERLRELMRQENEKRGKA